MKSSVLISMVLAGSIFISGCSKQPTLPKEVVHITDEIDGAPVWVAVPHIVQSSGYILVSALSPALEEKNYIKLTDHCLENAKQKLKEKIIATMVSTIGEDKRPYADIVAEKIVSSGEFKTYEFWLSKKQNLYILAGCDIENTITLLQETLKLHNQKQLDGQQLVALKENLSKAS